MRVHQIFGNWPYINEEENINSNNGNIFPRISVITPSFNQGEYIEETILSVIHQGYPNLQFIIIDGGSSDKTISIIKKYETYIDYWVSEKDAGQSDAINKGLIKADGEIINWLCSDDLLAPNALHTIAQKFTENPHINIVSGISRKFDEINDLGMSTTTIFQEISKLLYHSHICQPSTWFRKSIFDKITPLNTELHYTMDSEMWIRYLLEYKIETILYLPKVLCGYRYHNNSKSVSQDTHFAVDKTGLIYPVLYIIKAPSFLVDFYKPYCKSDIHNKITKAENIDKREKNRIIQYYVLKTITFSKIKGKYLIFIKSTIYYITHQKGISILELINLLKQHIAPKFFK
jgi:glycosyltransferase involved in cell wall biosynthesis